MNDLPSIAVDGYENVITGVGTDRDPTKATVYRPDPILTPDVLEAIFHGDGLGRRIVEMVAEDMVREWLELEGELREGDEEAKDKGTKTAAEEILDILEEIGAEQSFIEAASWARLYGGSVALIVLDDGLGYDQPVNEGRIQSVKGMRIYDRTSVTLESNILSRDPVKALQGWPEYFMISPMTGGAQFRVHESRIVVLPGQRTPERARQMNGGWDHSILQGSWEQLRRHGASLAYAENIVKSFVQAVLSIKGLTDLIASGREEVVKARLRLLDVSKSLLNAAVMDADGEQFNLHASSVSGLPELMDRFSEALSSSTGIPMTVLFGRSPAGQNSTGESDLTIYDQLVAREQKRVLSPLAERLIRLIFLSKEGPTGGAEPDAWSFKWKPLRQLTEKEEAELKKIVAETDKIYIETAVVSPQEVMLSRFGSGTWSPNMIVDKAVERDSDLLTPDPLETAEAMAEISAKTQPAAVNKPPNATNKDTAPRTLYVSRKVLNVGDWKKWAKAQGIILDKPEELHVTVCYSKNKIDWMKAGTSWDNDEDGSLTVPPGGPRSLEKFGDNGQYLVLAFASNRLQWRHTEFRDAGASWDWEDYQPHISLTKAASLLSLADVEKMEPFRGKIVLGPEIFEEIKED